MENSNGDQWEKLKMDSSDIMDETNKIIKKIRNNKILLESNNDSDIFIKHLADTLHILINSYSFANIGFIGKKDELSTETWLESKKLFNDYIDEIISEPKILSKVKIIAEKIDKDNKKNTNYELLKKIIALSKKIPSYTIVNNESNVQGQLYKKMKYIEISLSEKLNVSAKFLVSDENIKIFNELKNRFIVDEKTYLEVGYDNFKQYVKILEDENALSNLYSAFNDYCKEFSSKILYLLLLKHKVATNIFKTANYLDYIASYQSQWEPGIKNASIVKKIIDFAGKFDKMTTDEMKNIYRTVNKKVQLYNFQKIFNDAKKNIIKKSQLFDVDNIIGIIVELIKEMFEINIEQVDMSKWNDNVKTLLITGANNEHVHRIYIDLHNQIYNSPKIKCLPLSISGKFPYGNSELSENSTIIIANLPNYVTYDVISKIFSNFSFIIMQLGIHDHCLLNTYNNEPNFNKFLSHLMKFYIWRPEIIKMFVDLSCDANPEDCEKIIQNIMTINKVSFGFKIKYNAIMAIFDVLCHGTEKIINKIIKTYETANELKQKIVSLDKDAKNFKKDKKDLTIKIKQTIEGSISNIYNDTLNIIIEDCNDFIMTPVEINPFIICELGLNGGITHKKFECFMRAYELWDDHKDNLEKDFWIKIKNNILKYQHSDLSKIIAKN